MNGHFDWQLGESFQEAMPAEDTTINYMCVYLSLYVTQFL